MKGLMQDWPLLVHRIIDHAAVNHRGARIVSQDMAGTRRGGYGAVRQNARKLAGALAARGIKAGDRIATLAWSSQAHLESWYGITGLGAVYHTLNPRLAPEQIAWIANQGGARALLFDAALAPLVAQIASSLRHIEFFVAFGAAPNVKLPKKLFAYDSFVARGRERDWEALDENAACGLCYTSGTTGDPRGVLYSHRSNMLEAFIGAQTPALRMTALDVVLPAVPMFHANFWGLNFIAPMTGASLVLPGRKLDALSLYKLLAREKVTIGAGVPSVLLPLLDHMKTHRLRLPHLKRMAVGGAPVPRMLIRAFEDDHGVEVVHCWGMTELSPIGTQSGPRPQDRKVPGAKTRQGWAQFGNQLQITDAKGRALPHDGKKVGRLKIKGPAVARAYYKNKAAELFDKDGWFDTGDIAGIDADGTMTITDRAKDVIKSGGEWISSVAIENLALGHPAVAQAAAIAVPHPRWGERPLLVVVKKPGARLTGAQLLAVLSGKLAKFRLPDAVAFVDALPHTAGGKIRKTQLRRQFADFRLPSRS